MNRRVPPLIQRVLAPALVVTSMVASCAPSEIVAVCRCAEDSGACVEARVAQVDEATERCGDLGHLTSLAVYDCQAELPCEALGDFDERCGGELTNYNLVRDDSGDFCEAAPDVLRPGE